MFIESSPQEDTFNPLISEDTAAVLYLRYHLDYDHSQVAEVMGWTEEQAKHVALQGLKRTKQLVFGI